MTLGESRLVARIISGVPHVITILVTYPGIDALPTDAFLRKRLKEVQERFPTLTERLVLPVDPKAQPYWVTTDLWTFEEVLSEERLDHPSSTRAETILALYERETERMEAQDIQTRPTFQLVRYTSPDEGATAYLAFSIVHAMMDGKRAINLLQALLLPGLEEAVNGFRSLPVPVAPTSTTTPKPDLSPPSDYVIWPLPSEGHSLQISRPPSRSYLEIDRKIISALGRMCKENGVPTLSPALLVSFTLAFATVMAKAGAVDGDGSFLPMRGHLVMAKHVPTLVTGNGVAVIPHHLLPDRSIKFWHYARDLTIKLGQRNKDLEYTPDTTIPPPMEQCVSEFKQSLQDPPKFSGSWGFSNLSYVPLPPNAIDISFTQSAMPAFPAPFVMLLIGSEAGTRVTAVFREGAYVNKAQADAAGQAWKVLVERILSSDEDVTVGQLVQRMLGLGTPEDPW